MIIHSIPREEKNLRRVLIKAEELLKRGEVIYFPTETLPALLAWSALDEAVLKVFQIKRRPLDKPLPLAVKDPQEIKRYIRVEDNTLRKLSDFIPGPLTIVASLNKGVSLPALLVKNGEAAFRVPDYKPLLLLLERVAPLTLTSANLHNERVLFHLDDALDVLGGEVKYYFVDYHHRYQGTPSSVVRLGDEVKVIRAGVVSEEEIRERLNG
ncbi:MAG: threonylcarbamoyl-AMP synthase [Thermoplasmata archaeon]|nr:threonylcarbamoyl-AMP synthase [Thermoplasmata archaeon]